MSYMLAISLSRPLPSVGEWADQLYNAGAGPGLLLLAAGVGLLMFGHQIYRITTSVALAAVGSFAAFVLCQEFQVAGTNLYTTVGVTALVLGGVGFRFVRIGAALLGGVTAMAAAYATAGVNITWPFAFWTLLGSTFVVAAAISFVRFDHVVMFTMAILGSVAFVSGLVAVLGTMPRALAVSRQLILRFPIVVWLSFIAPAVIGFCYQMGEFRSKAGHPKA